MFKITAEEKRLILKRRKTKSGFLDDFENDYNLIFDEENPVEKARALNISKHLAKVEKHVIKILKGVAKYKKAGVEVTDSGIDVLLKNVRKEFVTTFK